MVTDPSKKSIGKVKCAYRLEARRVREPDFPYQAQFNGTADLARFAQSLVDLDIEKMVVLYLNGQNELIGLHIQPGSVSQANVYPREIVKIALLYSASAIILIHNHPSGTIQPSDQDISVTKKIRDAAGMFDILVHDHMIVSEKGWVSLRDKGLM